MYRANIGNVQGKYRGMYRGKYREGTGQVVAILHYTDVGLVRKSIFDKVTFNHLRKVPGVVEGEHQGQAEAWR
jgi:hypothetical protein